MSLPHPLFKTSIVEKLSKMSENAFQPYFRKFWYSLWNLIYDLTGLWGSPPYIPNTYFVILANLFYCTHLLCNRYLFLLIPLDSELLGVRAMSLSFFIGFIVVTLVTKII